MAFYKKLKQLEFDDVKEKDIVEFWGIKYKVLNNSLVSFYGDRNDKIFIVLGILNKYDFCSKCYGYLPPGDHSAPDQFPISKINDFAALTRVVKEIMKLCEK